ncbi:putative U-snRNP-associated cyclophilin [Podospora appendiculata]|uniref:Peptidyl-prolyl cis-trans isomerase n=1 Tax=Podospora appendiculata TaxID=314037 RepID=A0AAE0WXR4_9PEZI|nr:putative U-snRNP-associated cyclophilin [Podospora appendiculata]
MAPTVLPASGNPLVFFDSTLGGEPLGRITFELFKDVVPRTAENFRQFCTGESNNSQGRPQGFKGSKFHRIIPNFMCQGGDFLNGDGTGSNVHLTGPSPLPTRTLTSSTRRLAFSPWLTPAPNTNGSQFLHHNGADALPGRKHVVFGKVVDGMDIVRKMEHTKTGYKGKDVPNMDVVIAQCGEM